MTLYTDGFSMLIKILKADHKILFTNFIVFDPFCQHVKTKVLNVNMYSHMNNIFSGKINSFFPQK